MTTPKINPLTGHEDGLPDPRPRHEILKELLASHQVDPKTHLYDIFYQIKLAMANFEHFVDKEIEQESAARTKRRRR